MLILHQNLKEFLDHISQTHPPSTNGGPYDAMPEFFSPGFGLANRTGPWNRMKNSLELVVRFALSADFEHELQLKFCFCIAI